MSGLRTPLREHCKHLQFDPHPSSERGVWCSGGSTVEVDEEAAVRLVTDRLGVELTVAAVLIRDLVPVLLRRT